MARQLLDDLVEEYQEWKVCLIPSLFALCNRKAEYQDVLDAFDELFDHLEQQLPVEILPNLARSPDSSEPAPVRGDRAIGLFHPTAEGYEVMACQIRWFLETGQGQSPCLFNESFGPILVENNPVGPDPLLVAAGDTISVEVGGFEPGGSVSVTLLSTPQFLGDVLADADGIVSTSVTLPDASPGVHHLTFDGVSEFGTGVTQQIRLEYPGTPAPGDTYSTYVCCFDINQGEFDENHRAQISYSGVDLFTSWIDDQGGVLVELFVFPNVGDPLLSVELTDTTSNESIIFESGIQPSVAGVAGTLQAVIIDLENEVSSNPASADNLEDAIAGLEEALDELGDDPADREDIAKRVEDAVGDLEAAVSDGEIATTFGNTEMDLLSAAVRTLADLSINEAAAHGGEPDKITEAEDFLAVGDTFRADGQFQQSVDAYKDAISKAEGA